MKKFLVVAALNLSSFTFACGSWTFQDLATKNGYRFYVSSVAALDKGASELRFMRSGSGLRAKTFEAFTRSGDRFKIAKGEIIYRKNLDPASPRPQKFRDLKIGRVDADWEFFEIEGIGKRGLGVRPAPNKQLQIRDEADVLVGEAVSPPGEARKCGLDRAQVARVVLLYAWKSRGLKAQAPAVRDWWR